MISLAQLQDYLAEYLQVAAFEDYAPNGLQVEGRRQINHIITGVTASQALIDAAIAARADAILVHHGYFWRGEDPCVVGIKRRRLQALLAHDISLLAYHLPLDAHPEIGNNVQLARLLDLQVQGAFAAGRGPAIGRHGELAQPVRGAQLAARLGQVLRRAPLHVAGPQPLIRRLAWCTGAAQDYIEAAAALGVDAYLTGEVSEQTVHVAREAGLHFFAAGHHATERYGIQALGQHLAGRFNLSVEFVDIDNPA